MRSQENRDDTTVTIATALGLFVLVLAVGGTLLWLGSSVLGLSDEAMDMLARPLIAGAVVAMGVYLLRHGRR